LRAVEDRDVSVKHEGSGVYRFALDGSSLQRGGTYTLRISTLDGDTLSATTTVPGCPATFNSCLVSGSFSGTFNRSRDTMDLRWEPVLQSRTYALRIDNPFGPFFLFTDTAHLRLNGELRNLFADNLPRVFIPGFRETILLTAVDSNYYDYYRT